MRSRSGELALCAVLLLAAGAARADAIDLSASVDRDRIALDEAVRVKVSLTMGENVDPESIELPSGRDFDVVSRSRSDQMSFGLGQGGASYRRIRVYELLLRPRREGTLTIDPGEVVADGKRYTTPSFRIEVGPARYGSPPPPSAVPEPDAPHGTPESLGDIRPPASDRDVFLHAVADPSEPWAGQQVTFSVYLVARRAVSSVQNPEYPQLDAFWSEELAAPTRLEGRPAIIDGQRYDVYLLRRLALFPLAPGEATIPPVKMRVRIGGSLFAPGREVERATAPVTLDVRELPPGAPAGFVAGNVGQLGVTLSASPTRVSVGDAITVKVTVSGQGNLRHVSPPEIPALPGLRRFDPTSSDTLGNQGEDRWGGTRTFDHVLVAEAPGEHVIPELSLHYFDSDLGTYAVARTRPVTITVRGEAIGRRPEPSAASVEGPPLQPLRSPARIEAPPPPIVERPWFVPALAAPALLLLGAAVVPRIVAARASGEGSRRRRGAGKVARRRLAAAQRLADGRDPAFWAELDRALHGYLALRLGRPTLGLVREELGRVLREAGAGEEAIAAVVATLDACDAGRFAPGALVPSAADAALASASTAIDDLEAQLR